MLKGLGSYVRHHHLALIALFVALGGVSYAAVNLPNNSVGAGEIKKNAVRSSEVKNNALKGVDVNEASLATVPTANRATTANSANSAGSAGTAGSANPELFAHILGDGTVDLPNSKGITQANVTWTGSSDDTYCFHGLPFQPRGGMANIDYSDLGYQHADAPQLDIYALSTCPPGTQAFVYLSGDNGASSASTTFYVVFYR